MESILLITIDELLLKGRNQNLFQGRLNDHIQNVLRAYHPYPCRSHHDSKRKIVESSEPFTEETLQALMKIPGLHSLYRARRVALNFADIYPAIHEQVKEELSDPQRSYQTFKVQTKRSLKTFPKNSMEISKEIGHHIIENFPQLKVDLHHPELVVHIKIMERGIYIASKRYDGLGGLPLGSSGHLISLLSGGLDSPVASYMMAKRGCKLSFAFFHAYPYVGDEVKRKILELSKVLSQYQYKPQLHIIPFGSIQKKVSDHCNPSYRTLLFRRFMVEGSTLLAKKIGAQGLVTGDSLGQVSSQTLANMALIDQSTNLTIFRPLIGFNKIEIINLARKVGTHDISIQPHDDACALFASKFPVTNPHLSYWENFKQQFPLQQELEECLEKREVYHLSPFKNEELV